MTGTNQDRDQEGDQDRSRPRPGPRPGPGQTRTGTDRGQARTLPGSYGTLEAFVPRNSASLVGKAVKLEYDPLQDQTRTKKNTSADTLPSFDFCTILFVSTPHQEVEMS